MVRSGIQHETSSLAVSGTLVAYIEGFLGPAYVVGGLIDRSSKGRSYA